MQEDGSIFPGIHTLTDDDARQQFSLGRASMIVGGSWNPGVFNDQFESTEDWETAELPPTRRRSPRPLLADDGRPLHPERRQRAKDAAWEVLKFLYSTETMNAMFTQGMGVMGVAAANYRRVGRPRRRQLAPTERDLIVPPEPELPTMTPDYQTVMQGIWDARGEGMDEQLAEVEAAYNAAFDQVVAEGKITREDFVIPDFDPLTWQPG
jgi:multiple sugar transport system substrate-binding protein